MAAVRATPMMGAGSYTDYESSADPAAKAKQSSSPSSAISGENIAKVQLTKASIKIYRPVLNNNGFPHRCFGNY